MKGNNANPQCLDLKYFGEKRKERKRVIWMFSSSDHGTLDICVPGKCFLQLSLPKHTTILYVKGASPQEPIHPGPAISASNFAST